ncbi:PcfJ domain-containing protein [Pseudaminobacter sp. NGMCC 1.201702]|uniref:hypothetical protein n=1 Tax=Pseudaminobacter sp. NGMCC 1.201702 TaxID=3391825 RepID=UPI0039EFC701
MNLRGLHDRDVEAIEEWLANIAAEERLNLGHMALLRCSVGRIAANNIRSEYPKTLAEGWSSPFPRRAELRHIVDWLVSSAAEGAAWLANVDEKCRPRKLLKCSSYADLLREADKAMDRKNAQSAKALGPDDERPVADLADGFRLMQLLTPAALDLESRRVHHCVGHGSYDAELLSGDIEIYSLRDRNGRPVLTIEIGHAAPEKYGEGAESSDRHREIVQIQGKRNCAPDPKHLELLKPYARQADWKGRKYYWPYVIDVDGIEHYLDEIPAGTILKSLCVIDTFSASLPGGLTVLGDAYIGRNVTELPENLDVGGSLMIASARPLLLPESLRVGGRVRLWHESDIQRPIPAHLVEKFEIAMGKAVKKMGGVDMLPHQWLRLFDDLDGIDRVDHDGIAAGDADPATPTP